MNSRTTQSIQKMQRQFVGFYKFYPKSYSHLQRCDKKRCSTVATKVVAPQTISENWQCFEKFNYQIKSLN